MREEDMSKDWKVGLERIGSGIYVDPLTKAIHMDEAEICAEQGKPYTKENAILVRKVAYEVIHQHFPDAKFIWVDK
jgi:hypothetical protein